MQLENNIHKKQFINLVAKKLRMKVIWKGKGRNEKGYNDGGYPIIECDKKYLRPLDVNTFRRCKKSQKIT